MGLDTKVYYCHVSKSTDICSQNYYHESYFLTLQWLQVKVARSNAPGRQIQNCSITIIWPVFQLLVKYSFMQIGTSHEHKFMKAIDVLRAAALYSTRSNKE